MCRCNILTDAVHRFLPGRCLDDCASLALLHRSCFSCLSFFDSDCSFCTPGANGSTSCRLFKYRCVAGLAPKRSPGKGVKRRREGARPAAPTKAVQAKKQRMLETPSVAARPIARLAAHSRHALSHHGTSILGSILSRNTSMQCDAMLFN